MLYSKVLKFIQENSLFGSGVTVIAAVSGGADSICLLDILNNIKSTLGFKLECAHLNHNLRGAESDRDEQYVRDICMEWNIPLHVKSVEVAKLTHGRSIEDAAREVRYAFFEELTHEKNAVIATAHNLNDNTETFFINLIRGSGSRGLCGVPIMRGQIVRPLLCVKRTEIVKHLNNRGIDYCVDSTNSDTDYLRNFIRHDILPRFESRADIDIHKSVEKAMLNLQSDNRALTNIANSFTDERISELRKMDDAVLYRVLTSKLEKQFGIILDRTHFEFIEDLINGMCVKVQVCKDIFAVNEYGVFRFERIAEKCDRVVKISGAKTQFCGKSILTENIEEVYNALTNNCIDCDKIIGNLYVRTRKDGDIFVCQRRKCTTHLKKLLINDKMEKAKRDTLCVVCDESDNIVFVENYGADKRFAASPYSKNIMRIEIIQNNGGE